MFPFSFLSGDPLLTGFGSSLTEPPRHPGLPAGLPRERVPAPETSGPLVEVGVLVIWKINTILGQAGSSFPLS